MIDADCLPTIRSDRVLLRWMTDADVDALFDLFSDAAVMRFWSSAPMLDRSDAEHLLGTIRDCFRRKDLFQWGVVLPDDDRVIGTCTLAKLSPANRRAELGFALARAHWGNGLMGEALTALLDHAFGEMNLHRLEADVDPRNDRSIRLLERLGFRREGLLRERWLANEEAQDTVLLGLLEQDWRKRS